MRVRSQADADLNEIIVRAVLRREPTVDFRTATAANFSSLSDPQILLQAASVGRVLVTHDRKTIPAHFGKFITHQQSPGVIIVPQSLSVHHAADDLILIWTASEAEEWINRIFSLPV
jgi:hypothetical protein